MRRSPTTDDIAARVARLERQIARLVAAVPARSGTSAARVGVAEAAAVLGCSVRQVSRYAARGLLVRLPKADGAAKNAATYFDRANVLALAESEEAAREWVSKRKYWAKACRSNRGGQS